MPTKLKAADAASPETELPTQQPDVAEPVAAPPPPQESAPAELDEPPMALDEPQWGNWRFTGDGPLTYAAIPVTVTAGDVITHLGPPAGDGRWEPTDDDATRHRDNHRPELELAGDESKEG